MYFNHNHIKKIFSGHLYINNNNRITSNLYEFRGALLTNHIQNNLLFLFTVTLSYINSYQRIVTMLILLLYLNIYFKPAEALSTTYIPSTKSPPQPLYFTLLFHINLRSSLIVFGGLEASTNTNNIWEFSLSSLTWNEIKPTSSQIPRIFYIVARSSSGGFASLRSESFYIFGGKTNLGLSNDLWKFDFKYMAWKEIITDSPPEARSNFGFASYFEANRESFVVFAGSCYNGDLNDLNK